VEDLVPGAQHPGGLLVVVVGGGGEGLEQAALDLEGGEMPAVGELDGGGQARVVADGADGGDRIGQPQVGQDRGAGAVLGLQRGQQQRGGAELEEGGLLQQV